MVEILDENIIAPPPSEGLTEKPCVLFPRANGRELCDNIADENAYGIDGMAVGHLL
jgi:hypothetical protein